MHVHRGGVNTGSVNLGDIEQEMLWAVENEMERKDEEEMVLAEQAKTTSFAPTASLMELNSEDMDAEPQPSFLQMVEKQMFL